MDATPAEAMPSVIGAAAAIRAGERRAADLVERHRSGPRDAPLASEFA